MFSAIMGTSVRSMTWTTKTAARLIAATRASNMDEAVQRYITGLRQRGLQAGFSAGVTGPPYDPVALAHVLGVKHVEASVLDCDGQVRLDPEDGLPIIEVDSASTRGRKRFTIAHEVGHLVLWELCGVKKRPERRTGVAFFETEIERLCNKLAVEILAPQSEVEELWAARSSASLLPRIVAALLEVHGRYDVSLRFAAVRIRELHAPRASLALVNLARREFDWHIGVRAPLRVWKAIDDWASAHPEETEGSGSYWEDGQSGISNRPFLLKRVSPDRLLMAQV